ncbi:MAG: hypothetical protein JXR51_05005 [Bacteroidales bacterium]|nr:hypothetical protein [Bacteroidales bacterium]MBN2756518.1 hypothetical protein [Bacteroidales bacterium]
MKKSGMFVSENLKFIFHENIQFEAFYTNKKTKPYRKILGESIGDYFLSHF